MKLLYIDLCTRTVNPTNSLILALLRLKANVTCYGPGFVSEDVLNGGIDRFVEKHGPFDFHVITMLNFDLNRNQIRYYSRYTCPAYPEEVVVAFTADLSKFLGRNNIRIILFLTAFDTYAISEEVARRIAETNGYIVTWAGGFSRPADALDDVFTSEQFVARYKGYNNGVVFGRWHDLVAQNESKFINLGHFMAESEFSWTSLENRLCKVAVPGQGYVRRQAAQQTLAKKRMLARMSGFKTVMAWMDHAGLRPHTRPLLQSIYNKTFFDSIGSVRYAYTDGSGYDHPIRKFFEIPALGTVLLCSPCAGFERLGFSDRDNAIVVTPDTIGDAVEWLQKSPDQAQRIADAGRALIWSRHSLHARAEQLGRCLDSIASGRFQGSSWNNGEFVVNERVH